MLRTRMAASAARLATAALPWLVSCLTAAAGAALAGWMPGVGLGLAGFAVALALGVGAPLARAGLRAAPGLYETWTVTAGLAWIGVGVAVVAGYAFAARDADALLATVLGWLPLLLLGGLGQVFIGALTYLMPVVIGGGPSCVRAGMAVLELGWPLRVTLRNTALAGLALAPQASHGLRTAWWALVLAGFVLDIVLFAVAGVRQARSRVQQRLATQAAAAADVSPGPNAPLPSPAAPTPNPAPSSRSRS
jgi:nitrite reductase (NO-forming)